MDEALLERYRRGDPSAAAALRNHLRAIAGRVIASPVWSIGSPAERQKIERDAADKALHTGRKTILGLATSAMAESAILGLEGLRDKDDVGGNTHVAGHVMVRVALEIASPAQIAAVERHVAECGVCRGHLASVREALQSASQDALPAAPTPAVVSEAPDPAPAREVETRRAAGARANQTTRGGEPSSRPPTRARPAASPNSSRGRNIIPAIVTALALGWLWSVSQDERAVDPTPTYASILPNQLPPAGRADEIRDATGRAAANDLEKGLCQSAADRLHTAALRSPSDKWLRYYEGLAYVCLRDGTRARAPLEAVAQMGGERPFGLDWWLAQAQLLNGDVDAALATLEALSEEDHPRADDAAHLTRRIREL